MSTRQFKKLQLEKLQTVGESTQEESTDKLSERKKNSFDLLLLDDENRNDNAFEMENEEEVRSPTFSSKKHKKLKNKKKKNLKNNVMTTEDVLQTATSRSSTTNSRKKEVKRKEDFDEVINKFLSERPKENEHSDTANSIIEDTSARSLLAVKAQNLNVDNELKKLFGKATIKEARREANGNIADAFGRERPLQHPRKTILVRPKSHWPAMVGGLGMECISTEKGVLFFRMTQNARYQQIQQQFYACIESHDPSTLEALLQEHPYHVDSLLQLSETWKQMGELEMSIDFLERILYAFEYAFHHSFNLFQGHCRLEYAIEENRSFLVALFYYISMLGREGTSFTALEYCKLLLSLDRSDPLGVFLLLDHYCLRAQQYAYLLKVYHSQEMQTLGQLSMQPNWRFSVALAHFHLESCAAQGISSTFDHFQASKSSNQWLEEALLAFPSLLPPLVERASISMSVEREPSVVEDIAKHGFFAAENSSAMLKMLIYLYVERNYALWKPLEVSKWLRENALATVRKVECANQAILSEWTVNIENAAFNNSKDRERYLHHIRLTESSNQIQTLPPDVVEAMHLDERIAFNLPNGPPQRRVQEPVIHANSNDPISLFFETLFPWNAVPNAPPLLSEHNSYITIALSSIFNRINFGTEDDPPSTSQNDTSHEHQQ